MIFPFYIRLGPWQIHPHWVFESLAYLIGFRLYLWQRARAGDFDLGDDVDGHVFVL